MYVLSNTLAAFVAPQLIFTCSKLTQEKLEKSVKYVES